MMILQVFFRRVAESYVQEAGTTYRIMGQHTGYSSSHKHFSLYYRGLIKGYGDSCLGR